MSDTPQHSGVSRETADLNEIMDRSMPHISDSPEGGAPSNSQGPSGSENVSRETSEDSTSAPSPANEKAQRRTSVYIYLVVLFGAAFLMLLLAYFVQQREQRHALDDLRSTTTASRQQLLEDIETLEQEMETLETQIVELEQQLEFERDTGQEFQVLYDGARNQASHLEYFLYKRSEAMELFWQLDRAYTQRQDQRCWELIELMESPEAEPLKNYLPSGEDRSNYDSGYADGWLSPAERYQEIYDQLAA